jgi:GT2 family glycosyltransferase
MANLFAMVTLKKSTIYTINALSSFFNHTKLEKEDNFYLIDNDNPKNNEFSKFKELKLINNKKPLSFAQNVNQVIDEAIKNNKNLIFLNNDIIFTKNWFKALSLVSDSISMPSNNQIFQYESDLGILKLKVTMNLNDFNNNHDLLEEILKEHKKKIKSGKKFQTLLMPFFAFKVPCKILKDVGHFDISYGVGGGEDIDYRIRCAIKGYEVNYLTDSYLLHFHGKSTWNIENKDETIKRNREYEDIFRKKWGNDMTKIFLERNNFLDILEKKKLIDLYKINNFTDLIKKL